MEIHSFMILVVYMYAKLTIHVCTFCYKDTTDSEHESSGYGLNRETSLLLK